MPLHQNQDGTWQWGKSGKKYKKKEDAIKQMKAIFASGYVEKHASLNDPLFTDINNKGNSYMTYTDVYNSLKKTAAGPSKRQIAEANADPSHSLNATWKPYAIKQVAGAPGAVYTGSPLLPEKIFDKKIGKFFRDKAGQQWYKDPYTGETVKTDRKQIDRLMNNYKKLGKARPWWDFFLFAN